MKSKKARGIMAGSLLGLTILLAAGCAVMTGKNNQNKWQEAGNNTFQSELFGENTYIFSPEDDPKEVNRILDELFASQEANQFGRERYALYFMPGTYDSSISARVGFYMQVAGLGKIPTETKIPALECTARWLGDDPSNHNACCNFWRGVENIEIDSNTVWAVSQATFMRRVYIDGALYLHDDYGWCSGGYLSDSIAALMVDSGSQQQWLSRNNEFKTWMGENWNMVFVGDEKGCDPVGTWPAKAYTSVESAPVVQEKPFLIYDEEEGFAVFVPELKRDAVGVSWKETMTEEDKEPAGETLSLDDFYVAKPDADTSETLNAALEEGKNLLLTPGIYSLDQPLAVKHADTVVLGMGLATLQAADGNACIKTADEDGIIIAGLLLDAGEKESENLMVVGEAESGKDHSGNPAALLDVFFRVGGADMAYAGKADTCITINSNQVIGDNLWVWRADHGDNVAWDLNTGRNGLVVNGDDVMMYALMVEHFQEYQTIWNGDHGRVIMYQSEIPYDVPSQDVWMSHEGTVNGYASFYVDDAVEGFEGWGLGIYSYHRDAAVDLNCVMELPDKEGVKVHNICAIMITGNPGISHVINNAGEAAVRAGDRRLIIEYENGLLK